MPEDRLDAEPSREAAGDGATAPRRCRNCAAPLGDGEYCPRCGQRDASLEVSFRELAGDALGSLVTFDTRAWRSLRTLVRRPGALTVEYWQGRRARWVPPLRFYLFVSASVLLLTSLVEPWMPDPLDRASIGGVVTMDTGDAEREDVLAAIESQRDEESGLGRWVLERIALPYVEAPRETLAEMRRRMPVAFFVLVPFFAAWLWLFYRRRRRYYLQHLVFSLHAHTAGFLAYFLGVVLELLIRAPVGSSFSNLVILGYVFLALRRAYGQGRLLTAIKTFALLMIHSFAIGVALLVSLIFATASA